MKLAVPKQTVPGESRVALTPAVVKTLCTANVEVVIEAGSGTAAHHDDASFETSGAVVTDNDYFWTDADVIVSIHPPTTEQISSMRSQSVLIGMLDPFFNQPVVAALATQGVTSFSMELLPRISRAQPMDVLSSQANIGGYESVILAADACPKIFPMMITAAGTIAPARVLVIGAGVAGLQAIATARRLGGVVEAYDIRPEVEEQIRSLGARFVKLPSAKNDAATAGGYAREQTEEDRKRQSDLMAKHVIAADAVITTAAVFGRPPPMLISQSVVESKKPGSVIVDLAASRRAGRGNCELTQPDERITTPGGVVIDGNTNLPARAPVHSSHVYANNMLAFLQELIVDGAVRLDLEDDLQKGPLLTHDGRIVNEMVNKSMAATAT